MTQTKLSAQRAPKKSNITSEKEEKKKGKKSSSSGIKGTTAVILPLAEEGSIIPEALVISGKFNS